MSDKSFIEAVNLLAGNNAEQKNAFSVMKEISEGTSLNKGIAQYYLGWMYEQGVGVPKSKFKAYEYWLSSALEGNVSSQVAVSYCYSNSTGAEEDLCKALAWLLVASFFDEEDELDCDVSTQIVQLQSSLDESELEASMALFEELKTTVSAF